ncbi:hypothetical protein [Nonomuraea ferruginea]|uniref:Uncharacterized protein n=1 Tax=Nonomuraea ferruginea TaxID=46174 RepID=A0ABT4SSF9_9ACTN|nr:hypothetical protein [Nonomuraea ferruginea]MDA0640197.1 hypothetical protein [Nonomuraea ferruginea]
MHDEMEAAAVQLVVLGLVQARDRWAALVEDGEDHQVVAGVDGDAEDAARCAAEGVADMGLVLAGTASQELRPPSGSTV